MTTPAYWGIYYLDPHTGEAMPCELDGGVFYCVHQDRDLLIAEATADNTRARNDHGIAEDRYVVRPVPAGTLVYEKRTDQTVLTGAHIES